ncbi:MAG: hypothetical protein H7246_08645, partial [Phycisphaerae bacterium]|nr:hypothetical protein [Saprospiraceae bacterium]
MKQLILPALAALFFWTGCTHYYYSPNTLNIPMLRKQHDASISIARYSGAEAKGVEAQAIYSPVKYAGVMFNHLKIPQRTNGNNGNYTEWGRGSMTEGGVGGYYPYRPFTLSLFGGYGGGWAENAYESNQTSIYQQESLQTRLQFQRWFLQPSLSFRVKWLQLGFGMRRVWLNYVKGDIEYQIDPKELDSIKNIESQGSFQFWEKGFSFGFHFTGFSLTYNNVSL